MALLLTGDYSTDFNLIMDEIRVQGDEIKRLQNKVTSLESNFTNGKSGSKFVASSSGGAVTDEIKFTNGILTEL